LANATLSGQTVAGSSEDLVVEGNACFPPESVDCQYHERGDRQCASPWRSEGEYQDMAFGLKVNSKTASTDCEPKPVAQSAGLVEFLRSSPYFAGLDPSDMDAVSRYVFERKVDKGEMITREGDTGEALYFVVSGAVKCFKTSEEGREQMLQIVLPGHSFNDVAVFDDKPNPCSAEAMCQVTLCIMAKSDMRRILWDHPRIASNAAAVLVQRIRHLLGLVEDLSFRQVIGRLARLLLDYVDDGMGPRLTQHEMAAAVGSAREVVGRSLKAMHEENAIRMERNRIVVVDREALRQMAGSPG
jgi:CRP/FNR family transcriptional regulator